MKIKAKVTLRYEFDIELPDNIDVKDIYKNIESTWNDLLENGDQNYYFQETEYEF